MLTLFLHASARRGNQTQGLLLMPILAWSHGALLFLSRQEDKVVNEGGQGTSTQGASPVNPVVVPDPGGQGRAKTSGRIHRGPGNRHAYEVVHQDGKADSRRR